MDNVEIATQVQRLVDCQLIEDVMYEYCRNVDSADTDAIADLFTDDCTADYGPGMGEPLRGKAAVASGLRRSLGRYAASSHHVTNIQIELAPSGSRASTITYLYAWERLSVGGEELTMWAQYHDELRRTEKGWKIAHRVLKVAGSHGFDGVEFYPVERVLSSSLVEDKGG